MVGCYKGSREKDMGSREQIVGAGRGIEESLGNRGAGSGNMGRRKGG